jgi:peptidoglycan/xylan/chitin deacetylase (PgdA/CDA1 family)
MSGPARKVAGAGRRAALALASTVGISRSLGRSRWRRNRLLILCYHGVSISDEHHWHPELFVTAEFLRRRFQLLQQSGCNVLPLGEALERLRDGSLPDRAVVLTFDDGFFNFLSRAMPVLQEFGFPATLYLSTYYCATQRPITSLTIRYLLWKGRDAQGPASSVLPQAGHALLRTRAGRDDLARQVDSLQVDVPKEDKQSWLASLAKDLGVDWDELVAQRHMHLMSPSDVERAAAAGFDIELHTHRHRTPDDRDAFLAEIDTNRRQIESMTGRTPLHFCYPSGINKPAFLPWLNSRGIASATTCVPGLATTGDDALLLPRFIDTMAQSETVFIAWLHGLAALTKRSQ